MTTNLSDTPPTSQNSFAADGDELSDDDKDWLRLATSSFKSSTSYIDSNMRKTWEDSLRAFNGQHPSDSKYNHPSYAKRSNLYRPKTRSIIRKNEAAAAAAFFSSLDVVSVEPEDENNDTEVVSAAINKSLLQYRLAKTIPWFQITMGGLQDAQTIGVACAHIYWDYKAGKGAEDSKPEDASLKPDAPANPEYPAQPNMPANAFAATGDAENAIQAPPQSLGAAAQSQVPAPMPAQPPAPTPPPVKLPKVKPISDKPVVDLIPIENIRIDSAADWKDPVGSSPFIIHMLPMYMMDVVNKMKSGEWMKYGEGSLRAACSTVYDSTRMARQNNKEDPYDANSKAFSGYEICWIQRHIHRKDDEDWEFYTLGDFALLTKPRKLIEVVFHGKRPYVIGCCILEAHQLFPTSVPQLGRDLQTEANEIANQRIDNVKFVLNKKWFVKRGKEADIPGLVRNVPGGVVMLDDPEKDVREVTWPDVTASAYEEQSRIDNDMNDLLGNFSVGQVMADNGINGPARNMAMLGQSSGTLVEYLLRTFVETFMQPVLRQVILLEQKYETDLVVLGIAAKNAKLMQKFGTDDVTDELLEQELTLNVNVGMGATDPQMKLQKFTSAMSIYLDLLSKAPPGVNMDEVGKEIFGYMGYRDGSRFLGQQNPQMAQLQQKLEEATKIIQTLQQDVDDKQTKYALAYKISQDANQTKLATTQIKEQHEDSRNVTTHLRAISEARDQRVHDLNLGNLDRAHQTVMQRLANVNHVAESQQMKGSEQ